MTTTWQEEARGIEPWPPTWIVPGRKVGEGPFATFEQTGRPIFTGPWYKPDADGRALVALDDPDVLAAFDRRLARRLGAPEEHVKDGAVVFTSAGQCCLRAGLGRFIDDWEWRADVTVDTDDPLLARVRAWRSVKP